MAERHDEQTPDWAGQLTAKLDRIVGLVRDHSVRPAFGVVRILILSVIGLFIALAALIAIVIGLFRLFDVTVFSGRTWLTDFLFGGMLTVAGAFLLQASIKAGRDNA